MVVNCSRIILHVSHSIDRSDQPVYFCANCLTLTAIAAQESEFSQRRCWHVYTHIQNPSPGKEPARADRHSPPCASRCMHTWGSALAQAASYRTWSPARSDRPSVEGKATRPWGGGKTHAGLLVQGLDHQHERRRSDFLGCLFIHDVQGRLVDQTNVQSILTEAKDSIVGPVQHVTEGHDVSRGTLENGFVLSGNKLVTIPEEFGPISLQDVWNLGTGREAGREW